MAYDSPLNQDDRDTSAALAAAARGSTFDSPNYSDETRAQSAYRMLPEMMQLGKLMEMRQRMNQGDRQIRILESEDRTKKAEEAEYGLFSEHLSGLSGKSPEEVASANQEYAIAHPDILRNKQIADSLSNLQQGNDNMLRSKDNSYKSRLIDAEDRDLELRERLRDTHEQTAINEANSALKRSEIDEYTVKATLADENMTDKAKLANIIGGARNLPDDVGEGLAGLSTMFVNDNPEDPRNIMMRPFVNSLASAILAHGRTSQVEQALAPDTRRLAPYAKLAIDNKINIDEAMVGASPQEVEANRQRVSGAMQAARRKQLIGTGKTPEQVDNIMAGEIPRINETIAHNAKVMGVKNEAKKIEDGLRAMPQKYGELAKRAAMGDPEAQIELNKMVSEFSFKANKLKGTVDDGYSQQVESNKRRQDELNTQTKIEALATAVFNRKDRATRTVQQGEINELRKNKISADALENYMKSVRGTKFLKNVKDLEDMKALLKGMREDYESTMGNQESDNIVPPEDTE